MTAVTTLLLHVILKCFSCSPWSRFLGKLFYNHWYTSYQRPLVDTGGGDSEVLLWRKTGVLPGMINHLTCGRWAQVRCQSDNCWTSYTVFTEVEGKTASFKMAVSEKTDFCMQNLWFHPIPTPPTHPHKFYIYWIRTSNVFCKVWSVSA